VDLFFLETPEIFFSLTFEFEEQQHRAAQLKWKEQNRHWPKAQNTKEG
jgi:hypothetical protein